MTARALLLALLITLAGCDSLRPRPAPIEIPKTVEVPVPVPCITDPIERPAFLSDRELLVLDDFGLVLELRADQLRRRQYEAKLEAALAGCR